MKLLSVIVIFFILFSCSDKKNQATSKSPREKKLKQYAQEDDKPAEKYVRVYPKDTTPPKGTRYPCAFSPLPSDMKGIPAYHHSFNDKFFALVVQAIHARLKAELALYYARQKRQKDEKSAKWYEAKIDSLVPKLNALKPPKSLLSVRDMTAKAIVLQKEIYAYALRGGDLDRAKHGQSGSLLRQAWGNFSRRFSKMDGKVNKSLFHHFCALDISGSTRVFEKK